MPVEEPRLSCPTAKTRPECGKASTCSIEIKFKNISRSSDAYRVGGCSLNPVAASVCLMLVREAALSTRFCMKCSTIHMHSMESPTFPTSSTLQKKQSGKQQKELEVNQIWDYNSSWVHEILQHVRKKKIYIFSR